MAINSLNYDPPVRHSVRHAALDYEHLEAAGELADAGKPLDALGKVFEHLLPNQKLPNLMTEAFSFQQGSSKVVTRIDGDDLVITVPLVKLSNDGRSIAALRYILTRIAATGQLYQPRLAGDDVRLEFRDRVARLHPAKVLEVLRRMPAEADANDDFLMGQFGAQPLERAPITPVDDAEFARCEAIWKAHWDNVEEILKECQRKRSVWFLNETTAYAIYKIKFSLPLTGFVASRLDEMADTFNDGHEDPLKRESTLARAIKDMRAVSSEELRKSLGHVTYAINPYAEGDDDVLTGHIGGNYLETIENFRSSGKQFEAALGMIGTYIYLLARFTWEEPIEVALKEGLTKASGKPWKEAATILCAHTEEILEKFTDEDEDDDEEEGDEEEGDEDGEESDDEEEGDE